MLARFAYDEIRQKYANGESKRQLAIEYEVSIPTIHRILDTRPKANYRGTAPKTTWQEYKFAGIPESEWPRAVQLDFRVWQNFRSTQKVRSRAPKSFKVLKDSNGRRKSG
jgi:hypothetical protein